MIVIKVKYATELPILKEKFKEIDDTKLGYLNTKVVHEVILQLLNNEDDTNVMLEYAIENFRKEEEEYFELLKELKVKKDGIEKGHIYIDYTLFVEDFEG